MGIRVKCPSCDQSTIPQDGHCEFCGTVVNRAAADAALARAALAPPDVMAPPAELVGTPRMHAARKDSELALLLAIAGFVIFPLAAPVGWVFGIRAKRQMLRHGDIATGMATAAIWIGGVTTVLWVLAIVGALLAPFLLRAELRRMEEQVAEAERDMDRLGIERGPAASAKSLRTNLRRLVPDPELHRQRDHLLAEVDAAVAAGTVDARALRAADAEAFRVSSDQLVDAEEAKRVFRLVENAIQR